MTLERSNINSKSLKELSRRADFVFIHVAFLKEYVEIGYQEVARLAAGHPEQDWIVNFVPIYTINKTKNYFLFICSS